MNFLSIDCSTDVGSLFVKLENKTFDKILQRDKSSNDLLMKQILDFFEENDLNFDDITKIFVNQGPGSFSGLRTSLAIAKGFSLSKNLKLFGYDTFVWSCGKYISKTNTIFSIIKVREKYYIKKFDKNSKKNFKAEQITEDKIIKKYDNEFKVVPKKLEKCFNEKILKLNNLKLVDLDHNVLEMLQLKGLLNESFVKPLYLS